MAAIDKQSKELVEKVQKCFLEKLTRLQDVWCQLGLSTDQQQNRIDAVYEHATELYGAMVDDEERLLLDVKERIEENRAKIVRLLLELAVKDYKEPETAGLYQLDHRLCAICRELEEEKEKRMVLVQKLVKEDKEVCQALDETCYPLELDNIPSENQIEAVKKHITAMYTLKKKRQERFVELKEKILTLLDEMDYSPDDTFTRDIVFEDENSFKMSARNIETTEVYYDDVSRFFEKRKMEVQVLKEKVQQLYDRLEISAEEQQEFLETVVGVKSETIEKLKTELGKLEMTKLKNMEKFISRIREELAEWWSKCYYSEQQKAKFAALHDDDYSETLLELHEAELKQVKCYYEKHEQYLKYVQEWNDLYTRHKYLQQRSKDPNRYKNRGAGMLEEAKERTRVENKLPKLEERIRAIFSQYELQHGQPLLVEGVRLPEYIQLLHHSEEQAKENEKIERQRAKRQEMANEMAYGSTSSRKRRAQTTPNKDGAGAGKNMRMEATCTRSPNKTARNTIYDLTPGRQHHHPPPRSTLMAPRNTLGVQGAARAGPPRKHMRAAGGEGVSAGVAGIASRTRRRALCSRNAAAAGGGSGGSGAGGRKIATARPVNDTGILSHLHDMGPPCSTSDSEFSVALSYNDFARAVKHQEVLTSTMHQNN